MYRYKLNEDVTEKDRWQQSRIDAFDDLEARLDNVKKLLRQGKLRTNKYYRENPDSYGVLIGTDLISEYINDIETLLKGE
jgi:outer membrane PBP1 activator LpoA protein